MRIRIARQAKLCANAFDLVGSFGRTQIMNPLAAKIKACRKAAGLNQAAFGRLIGVNQSTVSRWERGKFSQEPTIENLKKIAEIGKMSLTELTGFPVSSKTVRVVGYVGDDAKVILFPEPCGDLRLVDAPDGSTYATVAIEIRTDSLDPAFTNWIVFYDDLRLPPNEDVVGKLCVIGLADGQIVVRKLARGQLPDRFNLLAMNGPPIYDVEVEWANKVRHMQQV